MLKHSGASYLVHVRKGLSRRLPLQTNIWKMQSQVSTVLPVQVQLLLKPV